MLSIWEHAGIKRVLVHLPMHHHRFADALSQFSVKLEADTQQALLAFLLQRSCPVLHLSERASVKM
jgi:hypothetical protein